MGYLSLLEKAITIMSGVLIVLVSFLLIYGSFEINSITISMGIVIFIGQAITFYRMSNPREKHELKS